MSFRRKTILLTGASGVVGTALVPELRTHRIIALAHRKTPRPPTRVMRGDLTKPLLGMDIDGYDRLAERVDEVIHCAAVTDFAADASATSRLNIVGTENIIRFARDADATLHYVSTAFVARTGPPRDRLGEAAADPTEYLVSKRAAEKLVRQAEIRATIVRPSVVIGDSGSGEIARFQGMHSLASAVLKNALPLLPLDPDSRIDFVPQDLVARSIAALVDGDVEHGEYWVTAGEAALTARQILDTLVTIAGGRGIDVVVPRLVQPDMVDRLIRPVFIEPLPPVARRRFDDMRSMTALFSDSTCFPSSLAELPGVQAPTRAELTAAFAASVDYLARTRKPAAQRLEAAA